MSRTLSAIVAVCDDWGIGREGDMLVANRADMRHFVRCTKGHTVILGRKTLESFPGGRPLKDRRNIVLTRDASFTCAGAEIAHSVDEALSLLGEDEDAWVIGGAEIYRQLLPHCTRAVVTKNHCTRAADTFSQISMAKSPGGLLRPMVATSSSRARAMRGLRSSS